MGDMTRLERLGRAVGGCETFTDGARALILSPLALISGAVPGATLDVENAL